MSDIYLLKELIEQGKIRCAFCGSNQNLEVDHIKPRVRGGLDNLENLQVLCEKCNRRKGTKLSYYESTANQEAMKEMIRDHLSKQFPGWEFQDLQLSAFEAYREVFKTFFISPRHFLEIFKKWEKEEEEKPERTLKSRSNTRTVLDIIECLHTTTGKTIPIEEVTKMAEVECIEDIDKVLKKMMNDGLIFSPKKGFIQKV